MTFRPIAYLRATRHVWPPCWFHSPIDAWRATNYFYRHASHSRKEMDALIERALQMPPSQD